MTQLVCVSLSHNGQCATRWLSVWLAGFAAANTCLTTTTQFWKGLAVWTLQKKAIHTFALLPIRDGVCVLSLWIWSSAVTCFEPKKAVGVFLWDFWLRHQDALQLPLLFSCFPEITTARIASLLMRGHVYGAGPQLSASTNCQTCEWHHLRPAIFKVQSGDSWWSLRPNSWSPSKD